MARFGMVGPDYQPDSIASDLQRTVNFYPEQVESGQGKNNYVLKGTPGLLFYQRLATIAVSVGGAGYTALDTLTVVGGTGPAFVLLVNTVAAGVITAVTIVSGGDYSVLPTNPVSVTGGTGAGATFTLTFATVVKTVYQEPLTRRIFAVARMPNASSRLFEISPATVVDRGALVLVTETTKCSISSNGTQLFIVEPIELPVSGQAFLFTLATNVLADITASVAAGNPRWGEFLDGYFIALGLDGRIYLSALNDGATWNAADVATPESSPDNAVTIKAHRGELVIFSLGTIERWYNADAPDYPFRTIKGATLKMGLVSQYSVTEVGEELMWAGYGQDGRETVWRSSGYQAIRVSNHAVETNLQDNNEIGRRAWSYQEHGHHFYLLESAPTGVAGTFTWAYDKTTGMWHRRMYLSGTTESVYRIQDAAVTTNSAGSLLTLGADGISGRIFRIGLSYLTDNGDTIRRYRRCPHLSNEEKKIVYDSVQIDTEPNLAANQRINFRWSNNGGVTWGAYRQVNVGPATSTVVVLAVEIVSGGTGYTVNDTLTVVGGVGTAATLTASTVVAGVITAVTILTAGAYTENPTNPVSVTGGTGTGATFTLGIPSFKPTRANFRRLGMARDRVYELMVEDPVEWTIVDAYLKARAGE